MTLRLGCFGTAVAAQASSETCAACPDRPECFAAVQTRSPAILDRIPVRMKMRGEEDGAPQAVERARRYIEREIEPKKTPLRELPRVTGLREKAKEAGIDLTAIKRGENPYLKDDLLRYEAVQFILEGVPFKPKDVIEHLHDHVADKKASSVASEVSRLLTLLVEEGVLTRLEKRILCLA
jgi:hypothetical protein